MLVFVNFVFLKRNCGNVQRSAAASKTLLSFNVHDEKNDK